MIEGLLRVCLVLLGFSRTKAVGRNFSKIQFQVDSIRFPIVFVVAAAAGTEASKSYRTKRILGAGASADGCFDVYMVPRC